MPAMPATLVLGSSNRSGSTNKSSSTRRFGSNFLTLRLVPNPSGSEVRTNLSGSEVGANPRSSCQPQKFAPTSRSTEYRDGLRKEIPMSGRIRKSVQSFRRNDLGIEGKVPPKAVAEVRDGTKPCEKKEEKLAISHQSGGAAIYMCEGGRKEKGGKGQYVPFAHHDTQF